MHEFEEVLIDVQREYKKSNRFKDKIIVLLIVLMFLEAVVGFIIGLANYDENITQSDLQDAMKNVLSGIHEHLEEQDRKMDEILMLLKEDS